MTVRRSTASRCASGRRADPAECCLGGPHLFLGYVDRRRRCRRLRGGGGDDDWFLTGDLAELHDGRLRITGRIKDIVIRNGLNIPIAEVDGMVASLPGVVQCAGYGVADDVTGERLAMAVRLAPGASLEFDAMVEALAAAGLAKWKIPEEVVFWNEPFPETASGKVQRNQLEELGAGFDRARSRARVLTTRDQRLPADDELVGALDLVDPLGDHLGGQVGLGDAGGHAEEQP